jgi:hypothetical protein
MKVFPCLALMSPFWLRWRPALLMLLSIVPATDSIVPPGQNGKAKGAFPSPQLHGLEGLSAGHRVPALPPQLADILVGQATSERCEKQPSLEDARPDGD